MIFRNYLHFLLSFLFWTAISFAEDKNVNVNIRTSSGGGWPAIYWVIGGLLLAVIVAVVAMAARSSGPPAR